MPSYCIYILDLAKFCRKSAIPLRVYDYIYSQSYYKAEYQSNIKFMINVVCALLQVKFNFLDRILRKIFCRSPNPGDQRQKKRCFI